MEIDFDNFKQQIRTITPFSDDECSLFVPFLRPKLISKGEYLIEAGQCANNIAFVQKGVLRMFYMSQDGKEINNHFFLENDYATSYLDFLKGKTSSYFIQAIEDSELLTFDAQALNVAYEQSKNWERFGRIIAEMAFISAATRTDSFLFQPATERYLTMLRALPHFIKRIPLYHLASYLGIERESLSRIRKEVALNIRK